jgi:hypothetical protein
VYDGIAWDYPEGCQNILSNWAIKKEEQTSNDDICMGLNENTIKVGCIIEAWVALQVVHVLPPIYKGLEVHSHKHNKEKPAFNANHSSKPLSHPQFQC